jgi:hypothetical protein
MRRQRASECKLTYILAFRRFHLEPQGIYVALPITFWVDNEVVTRRSKVRRCSLS